MWSHEGTKKSVTLRGTTKQESTSSQTLKEAKDARERRRVEKIQPLAARKIQRSFRGASSRAATRAHFQSEWIRKYASLAHQPTTTAIELNTTILPLAVHAVLPPLSSAQRAALEAGIPFLHLQDTAKTCIRGTMYIILKYFASQKKTGEETENSQPSSVSISPPSLLTRVATLCAAVVGCEACDVLLQTAAARVLYLMLLAEEEKRRGRGAAASGEEGKEGEEVWRWFADRPMMIPLAAQRLITTLSSTISTSKQGGEVSSTTKDSSNPLEAALGNLISAQFLIFDAIQESSSENVEANALLPLKPLMQHVLTGPTEVLQRVLHTSPAAAAHLLSAKTFCQIVKCIESEVSVVVGSSSSTTLRLLTTLTTLFITPRRQDGRCVAEDEERCKVWYAGAIDKLTTLLLQAMKSKMNSSSSGSRNGGGGDAVVSIDAIEAAVRMFGDGGVVGKLQSVLELSQFCNLYCIVLEISSRTKSATLQSTTAIGVGASLRLLSALAFGSYYGGNSSSATDLKKNNKKDAFLPTLWRWLAMNIGLPLEIAVVATIFEIPSLPQGIHSIAQHAQQPFILFCQAAAHYLSAADDVEFYEEQEMFSLAQHRAIAASLIFIIFRSYVPLQISTTIHGGGGVSGALALQHPSRLLRALFDRDTRRQFCSAEMWLGPYRQAAASKDVPAAAAAAAAADVSGAAVLRALLQTENSHHHQQQQQQEGESDDDDGNERSTSSSSQRLPTTGLAGVLLQAPQCIPFEARVEVFRGLVALDKQARRYNLAPVDGGPRPLRVVIRRTRLLEDALATLLPAGSAVRGPLSISFIDAHGGEEAGIDMGGLTKELLDSIITAVLHPNRGLFAQTEENGALFPHPLALSLDEGPALFTLTGMVLGKALYEGILLPAPLAPFFIARLQGRLPTLDDVSVLDPEVHRSLVAVNRYTGDAAADLGLDFTIENDIFGAKVVEELVPGGAAVAVTNANKFQYVHLVSDWHLRRRLDPAAASFSAGLAKILPLSWLKLFSAREVNELLGGGADGGDIDVDDLRKHTKYSGGYSSSSRTVQMFWKVVRNQLLPEERRLLLKFATSCSRAPLGGFQHLSPPFTLHKVDGGAADGGGGGPFAVLGIGKDVQRLPTASTCSSTLKLPNYKKESTLKEKLLFAIRSGAGFDLS